MRRPWRSGSPCHRGTSSGSIGGSVSADNASSANYGGIKNPAIDHLIDKVIFAEGP
jgi:microcin C transport system substrate-binding protein